MTIARFLRALDAACDALPENPKDIDTEDALYILDRLRELGDSPIYFACVRKYAAHLGRTSRSVKEANAEHLARTLAAKASSAFRGDAHTPEAELAGAALVPVVAPTPAPGEAPSI